LGEIAGLATEGFVQLKVSRKHGGKTCITHMNGDGKMKVPTGPGPGIIIDPEFAAKHQPVL